MVNWLLTSILCSVLDRLDLAGFYLSLRDVRDFMRVDYHGGTNELSKQVFEKLMCSVEEARCTAFTTRT